MRDKNRKAFVLNGETLQVETACGGVKIKAEADGRIISVAFSPYDGAAVDGPSEVVMVGSGLEANWMDQWAEDRQPWHLYQLLRRLED